MSLRAAREVNNGFGDGLATAFEMVVTPAIFGFLGYLLDRRIGTVPVFTIVFALLVLGYECYKLVARYNHDMVRHTEDKPWTRQGINPATERDLA